MKETEGEVGGGRKVRIKGKERGDSGGRKYGGKEKEEQEEKEREGGEVIKGR